MLAILLKWWQAFVSLFLALNLKLSNFGRISKVMSTSSFVILVTLTIFIYFAAATGGRFRFNTESIHENSFVLLAQALSIGQLHLPQAPSPELLQMENPYDTNRRHELNVDYMWDTSLYKEKLYIYWGVVPIVLFYMPWKYVFNSYPPIQAVTMFLSLASLWLLIFLCYRISEQKFQMSIWCSATLLTFTFGTSLPIVMTHPLALPISCALFFSLFGWCLLLKVNSSRVPTPVFVAAGLCFALAMAARPTYFIYCSAALLGVLVKSQVWPMRQRWLARLYFTVPIFIVAILMLVYNYLRFDSPFEFGVRYQLGLLDHTQVPFNSFSLKLWRPRLINHLWYDLFSGPAFIKTFPFIELGPRSTSFWKLATHVDFSYDSVNGVLFTVPVIGLSMVLLPVLIRRKALNQLGKSFLLLAGPASLAVFVFLTSCWYTSQRYLLDFQAIWLLAALLIIHRAKQTTAARIPRSLLNLAIITTGLATIMFGLLASLATMPDFWPTLREFVRLRVMF